MSSEFLRPDDEYVREINVVEGYFEQTCMLLHKRTGKPMDVCRQWVKEKFATGGEFHTTPPTADVLVRDKETGDRKAGRMSIKRLFETAIEYDLIISPSMTFYVPAKIKRSLLAIFIDENIQKRGRVKKEMFAALAEGDELKASNKKNEQNSFKQRNNAMSGAHSSPYTILYNKSTHSSLTSMCRSATSYGNASNEKLLAGSRHYWAPGIVINNILSILTLTDMVKFKECVDFYNLYIPTADQVMECITYSTKLFWRNGRALQRIRDLVDCLEPLDRAAFVYIGDLYHVAKYNDSVVRGFLDDLLIKRDVVQSSVKEVEDRLDGDTEALVALLRRDAMNGKKNFWKVREDSEENYSKLIATCEQIYDTTKKYSLFIKEIMTTKNVPASIAKLPDTIRRVSLVSDTDSTMATVETWATWYCGESSGSVADDVSDMMIYMATQNIAHMMARMSTQIGVENKYRHRYAMKNEFKFSSFSLTNKAKHYFSLITSQEGVLKSEPELEIKGVALRTSNIPPIIMDEFRERVIEISTEVMNGRNIKIIPFLHRIAEIENSVKQSLFDGKYTYLKTGNIKIRSAYSEPEKSAYTYYEMWEATFGKKYGSSGEPTFSVVKVSVDLGTKTHIKRWLSNMKDRNLAADLEKWFKRFPNRKYTQILLPESIVEASGIPIEILDICAMRRIIFASVEPYYHILESLGIYTIDKHRTRLISDTYGKSTTFIDTDSGKECGN